MSFFKRNTATVEQPTTQVEETANATSDIEAFKAEFADKARSWGQQRGYGSYVESFLNEVLADGSSSTEQASQTSGTTPIAVEFDVRVVVGVDAGSRLLSTIEHASAWQIVAVAQEMFDLSIEKATRRPYPLSQAEFDSANASITGVAVVDSDTSS